ncbi:MAG: preprotein translocase subunit SecA [Streptosporangiaceae bacterium]|nr:preprotein translocase subunit SecA [Streptosporangiaceae bacterium]
MCVPRIRGVTIRHGNGQPVVIAVRCAEAGERVSRMLGEAGVVHAVLLPGDTKDAAAVMAGAGRLGAVTVICGMAGRGYRVLLGGDPGATQAAQPAGMIGLDPPDSSDNADPPEVGTQAPHTVRVPAGSLNAAESEQVIKTGGLAVLGSERSQSQRMDDWLRGLAGQRGEPGESRFLIDFDDSRLAGLHGGTLGALRRRSRGGPVGFW